MASSRAAAEVAIQKFGEVLRVERLLDEKNLELQAAIIRVPDIDKNFYVAETEAMRKADEEIRGKRSLPAGR